MGPALLIGFPKCASTTLFELLRQHPDICGTLRKETWILYPAIWGRRPASSEELDTFDAALGVAGTGRMPLEASPCNVYAPRVLIEQLRERFPDAQPIAVVRDPVQRLLSAYGFLRARGQLRRTNLAGFVERGIEGVRQGLPFAPGTADGFHLASGLYGRHLLPWAEVFDGRLAVMDAAVLRDDAAGPVADLWRSLGLEPQVPLVTGSWNEASSAQSRGRRTGAAASSLDDLPEGLRTALSAVLDEDASILVDLLARVRGPVRRGSWMPVGVTGP